MARNGALTTPNKNTPKTGPSIPIIRDASHASLIMVMTPQTLASLRGILKSIDDENNVEKYEPKICDA